MPLENSVKLYQIQMADRSKSAMPPPIAVPKRARTAPMGAAKSKVRRLEIKLTAKNSIVKSLVRGAGITA